MVFFQSWAAEFNKMPCGNRRIFPQKTVVPASHS